MELAAAARDVSAGHIESALLQQGHGGRSPDRAGTACAGRRQRWDSARDGTAAGL